MSVKHKKLPPGYMGHILHVDLSTQTIKTEALDPHLARLFFGGRGLGIALLFRHFLTLQETGKYRHACLACDPLSEDNIIIISTSPTTGTRMPTSGRIHMNYKSPLTEGYGSTNGGGKWSVDFKKNGYDVMIITGKAKKPIYLVISPDGVAFADAKPIADLDAVDCRSQRRDAQASCVTLMFCPLLCF